MSTRLLLACGAVGPAFFVLVFLTEGAVRPGYNPWRHAVSQLSLGAWGWVNVVALVVTGLLLLAFAGGLKRVLQAGVGAVWGPRLLRVIGLSVVALGVFPDDPASGFPPGMPSTHSLHGLVHGIAGLIFFGSLAALCFVFARRFRRDFGEVGWAGLSTAAGVVVATCFVACSVLAGLDQAGVLSPAPSGLVQRLALVSGLGWLTLLAFRLLREGRGAA